MVRDVFTSDEELDHWLGHVVVLEPGNSQIANLSAPTTRA